MKKVGLIFGGIGNEAKVSIDSAENIINNFDKSKFKLILIFWKNDGNFYKIGSLNDIDKLNQNKQIKIEDFKNYFNIAFPITHGKFGEDGVLQGMLESQRIKYCGCHILCSALCMDKDIFKTFIYNQRIKQVKFSVLDYRIYVQNGNK